jgi:hypothetical protein
MIPELTQYELSKALDSVAAEAVASLARAEPPVDALQLACDLGLQVAWDANQAGRGRVVRLRSFTDHAERASILVRPEERRERLQWAVAHELGELCSAQVFDLLAVDPREAPPGAREMIANQMAGRLLLPRRWFLEAATSCGWDLAELKSRFGTASHELIARRMLDFAPLVTITIFDHGQRTFRRANTPIRAPSLIRIEAEAWRDAHELGHRAIRSNSMCRVQAWPVHEPGWKREILRTLWRADEDLEALL